MSWRKILKNSYYTVKNIEWPSELLGLPTELDAIDIEETYSPTDIAGLPGMDLSEGLGIKGFTEKEYWGGRVMPLIQNKYGFLPKSFTVVTKTTDGASFDITLEELTKLGYEFGAEKINTTEATNFNTDWASKLAGV